MKKFLILILIMCMSFCIVGCDNDNQKAISTIKETINKIDTVINNMYQLSSFDDGYNTSKIKEKGTISKQEIVTYTPSDNFEEQGTGYNGSTFTSLNGTYTNQPNKFTQIKQEINYLSENTNSLIKYIMLKSNNIKVICTQYEEKNTVIDDETCKKSNTLCSKLLLNTNRLEITKNDVKNSYEKLKKKQTNDYQSYEMYNEYTNLSSNLQTRNTYLNNICYDIDELETIMEETLNNNLETTKKTWSNIDTYKSNNLNNKKINSNNYKTNNNYNNLNDNNIYNYPYNNYNYGGYGNTNPYYRYGGYGSFRGFGANGYGMYPFSPYTNYNPYMPNIDTFGSYKNIDTYRPINDNNEIYNEDYIDKNENNSNNELNCIHCPYCHRKIYLSKYQSIMDYKESNKTNDEENINQIKEKVDKITTKLNVLKPNKPPKIEKL